MLPEINNLIESIKDFEQGKIKLVDELRGIDKFISHLYHVLEFESLDAVKMVKLTKKLKETLIERRCCKNKLRYLESISSRLEGLGDISSIMCKLEEKECKDMEKYKSVTKHTLKDYNIF